MIRTKPRPALLLVIFGVLMVSYSGPMVKGALNEGASPVTIALVRMLSAGLLLFPFELRICIRRRIPLGIDRSQGLWILLASLFLAAHYLSWMTSMKNSSTFASVALVCTQPLFVALFSFLLFKERMPRRAMPGALLAFCGAVLIAISGLIGDDSSNASGEGILSGLLPNLFALLGAVMMAAHWLTARHIRQTLPAEVYTPALYLVTAVFLALCVPLMGGFQMPLDALPYMAGLVLGSTLLGHAVFSFALSHISASVVSFALLGEPVGAMLLAMIFLGETPTLWVFAGGALTLIGLCFYLAFERMEVSPKTK